LFSVDAMTDAVITGYREALARRDGQGLEGQASDG
jgi:hypothetical protein